MFPLNKMLKSYNYLIMIIEHSHQFESSLFCNFATKKVIYSVQLLSFSY